MDGIIFLELSQKGKSLKKSFEYEKKKQTKGYEFACE